MAVTPNFLNRRYVLFVHKRTFECVDNKSKRIRDISVASNVIVRWSSNVFLHKLEIDSEIVGAQFFHFGSGSD